MTATLLIVRHGNTFGPDEAPRRIGGRTDLPLVESGRAQAVALGRAFREAGLRPSCVLTSPQLRASETAELILAELGGGMPAIEPRSWLAEIDHGPDEGQLEDAVVARIGDAALAGWNERGVAPAGWVVDRDERIAGWRALFETARRAGDTTLLVTSNGAARFAMFADPTLAAAKAELPSLKMRTGAWGVLQLAPSGTTIEAWDRRP